jgi:hypothetical protein
MAFEVIDAGLIGYRFADPGHAVPSPDRMEHSRIGSGIPPDAVEGLAPAPPDALAGVGIRAQVDVTNEVIVREHIVDSPQSARRGRLPSSRRCLRIATSWILSPSAANDD